MIKTYTVFHLKQIESTHVAWR